MACNVTPNTRSLGTKSLSKGPRCIGTESARNHLLFNSILYSALSPNSYTTYSIGFPESYVTFILSYFRIILSPGILLHIVWMSYVSAMAEGGNPKTPLSEPDQNATVETYLTASLYRICIM